MSSIQERLQLKRVPLDTWNIREQLCLASAVVRSGDQNWMSVSRALKTVGEPNRPPDWYSQKSCAAQYGALLEHVETPKRKKRSSEGAVETPQESILKRLTQERIVEIQKNVAEMNQQYELLRDEINEVRSVATSETRLRDLWAGVEAAKRAREREHARRAQWLKERDEKRAKAERTWRPSGAGAAPVSASPTPAPSSPLLTSLLKSSPVVTTPQHISHPANVVDTVSPSAGAPTLSMLLEHNRQQQQDNKQVDNKHIAIENIKSQLVQIELQLKAGAPAVDIDDIEIKAEDVYAFRDVDIHLPPVAAMHKHNARTEKPTFSKKEESESTPVPIELPEEKEEEVVVEDKITEQKEEREVVKETIGFPEVKFPTPEIKVIQPDEQKVKEEVKEAEVTPEVEIENAEAVAEEEPVEIEQPAVAEDLQEIGVEMPVEEGEAVVENESEEVKAEVEEESTATESVEVPVVEAAAAEIPEETPQEAEQVEELLVKEEEIEKEKEGDSVENVIEPQQQTEVDSDKRTEDVEESLPLKEMIKEESEKIKEEVGDTEETHTETDDDTPMEVVREEDKDGKKRRDYSRKRASRPCSGSESAPDSPGHAADKHYRLWKKSVMYVYTRLAGHKYASLFLRPITDEEAPGYSTAIKRPMDLTTIKRLIENGTVRTTVEFQRLILLMLSNALMYNSTDHSVYRMAKELHEEASVQVGMLVAAQAVAGVPDTQPRRKRSKHAALHPAKRTHH